MRLSSSLGKLRRSDCGGWVVAVTVLVVEADAEFTAARLADLRTRWLMLWWRWTFRQRCEVFECLVLADLRFDVAVAVAKDVAGAVVLGGVVKRGARVS